MSIFYICDRRACSICNYPMCQHTENIEHAEHFRKDFGHWVEEYNKDLASKCEGKIRGEE